MSMMTPQFIVAQKSDLGNVCRFLWGPGTVTLITSVKQIIAQGMTVAKLQDQLDVMKSIWNDKEIQVKSQIPRKADKQAALLEAFRQHETRLIIYSIALIFDTDIKDRVTKDSVSQSQDRADKISS
ncbi:hypothetical protein C8J56DRAFT_894860 [Mycena floridula]|nr:hypothetical protein C8J56DRAFT_894860 [Mycena floridula]